MKKKIVILAAFVMLAITTTFAAGSEISKTAQETFTNSFAKASEVKWENEDTYYKASFKLNGQSLNALISEEGKLIAVSRNILSTDLPVSLQLTINKQFSEYWITELVEYAVNNETLYYLTVENADQKSVYESAGTYGWSLIKKINK